jgi:putative RecB family exonuclease
VSLWSHSRLETFRHCPRKYFYRYVKKVKLPEEPETVEQFVGSRAHDALEWLYGEAQRGVVPTAEALLEWLRVDWDAEWHDAITMPGGARPPEQHRHEAERWLSEYHARHAPFDDARTVGLEQRVNFPLDDAGKVNWVGFMDRVAVGRDGTWQIHDYKTNRKLPTQQEKDADPQLAYYEIGVRRMWPKQVERVELRWHFLKFGVSITSRRTPEQLEGLKQSALVTITDAESRAKDEAAFPVNESRLCDWCEFQQICPVRKHRFKLAELPPNKFMNEPGVKLVDHWASLDEQRRELKSKIEALEAEIADVQQALAAFARREGLEVVAGSEREATVRTGESVMFPRKSVESEEADALEQQLRASTWWSDASSLDRHALKRLWDRRASLDADLRALLEEYARTETSVDVRLRKKKD